MAVPPSREKFPSLEEISEKLDTLADEVRRGHESSDPPQLKWIDRRLGMAVRKAAKVVLLGALGALGAGAAGWTMRDCQAKLESRQASPGVSNGR